MMSIKIKIFCLVLSLAAVLCGCSSRETVDAQAAAELSGAINNANSASAAKGDYMLEITFGEGSVLYYAKGDIEFDRVSNTAFADFNQTWLGTAVAVQNFFNNGKMISVTDGEPLEIERDADELFSKFPYAALPEAQNGSKITVGNNSLGTTYSVTLGDTAQICDTVVGDIYSLVTVIKKPQRDKTRYSDTVVTYTVSDGKIVACRYEFSVTLFDTPAYVPNYEPPESEYTVEMKVSARVSYSGFDSEVSVTEYSEAFESSEESK